jgi:hypothetical protein
MLPIFYGKAIEEGDEQLSFFSFLLQWNLNKTKPELILR